MEYFFLHGLDSSSRGTKGNFFRENFSFFALPDFEGDLKERLARLETLCQGKEDLILVGSSFGGLMAACFAIAHESQVNKLILLAPALNFPGYRIPEKKIGIPVYLLIGSRDTVTPKETVLPLAEKSFANLEVNLVNEDHLLHQSFASLDWAALLEMDD